VRFNLDTYGTYGAVQPIGAELNLLRSENRDRFRVWGCCAFTGAVRKYDRCEFDSSRQLQTGDSLEFLFAAAIYASMATQLAMGPYADSIDFVFSSLSASASGNFTAEIESFAGTTSATFGTPLYWTKRMLARFAIHRSNFGDCRFARSLGAGIATAVFELLCRSDLDLFRSGDHGGSSSRACL
jgi:hypothetical protein